MEHLSFNIQQSINYSLLFICKLQEKIWKLNDFVFIRNV